MSLVMCHQLSFLSIIFFPEWQHLDKMTFKYFQSYKFATLQGLCLTPVSTHQIRSRSGSHCL